MAGGKRIRWIDVAKGVAILSILVHHIPFFAADGSSLFGSYVALYDVCLFYVVAGFFLGKRKPLVRFVLERARRLLVPYVVTCAVMGAFVLWCKYAYGVTSPPTIWTGVGQFVRSAAYGAGLAFPSLPEGVTLVGAIWFLEAMFVALVEAWVVVRRLGRHPLAGMAVAIALALAALWMGERVYVPFNVEQGVVAAPFVLAGWLYRRYGGLDLEISPLLIPVLLAVALGTGSRNMRPSFVTPSFGGGIVGVVGGLCATVLVIELSKGIERLAPPVSRVLEFFGNNSLTVLCAHLVMLDCGMQELVTRVLGLLVADVTPNAIAGAHLLVQVLVCTLVVMCGRALRRVR